MPEPWIFDNKTYKHYDDEDLNYGYVFVPNNSYELEKDFHQAFDSDAENIPKKVVTIDFSYEENEDEKNDDVLLNDALQSEDTCIIDDFGMNSPTSFETKENYIESTKENDKQKTENKKEHEKEESDKEKYRRTYGKLIRQTEKIFSMYNVVAVDQKPDTDDVNRIIKRIMKEYESKPVREANEYDGQITYQGKTMAIDDSLFDDASSPEFVASDSSFAVADTDFVSIDKADHLLGELIDRKLYPRESKGFLKDQIKKLFRKKAGFNSIDIHSMLICSKMILVNKQFVQQIIRDLDDSIREVSYYEFKPHEFRFPESFRIPPEADTNSKRIMHFPLSDKASGPEKIFEKHLNSSQNVVLWYKNADHGENAFCVPYKVKDYIRGKAIERMMPTYPDFIVILKDGIGIYETKDFDKKDEMDDKKNLAIAELVNRIDADWKVYGGLLYIKLDSGTIVDIEKHPELI